MVNTSTSQLSSLRSVTGAVDILNPVLINLFTALIILLGGFIVGSIVRALIYKLLHNIELNKLAAKKLRIKASLEDMIAQSSAIIIYLIAIIIALDTLRITTTVITTIVILLIIVVVLFLVFGLNDLFGNLFAGIYTRMRSDIAPGDYIKLKNKGVEGYVIKLNLTTIRLETGREEMVYIPYITFMRSAVIKVKKRSVKHARN